MKKKATILLCITFLLLLSFRGGFALEIITPFDKSYTTTPFIYVVGKLGNEKTTHITVSVNDIKSPLINIKSPEYVLQFKDYFILDIELEDGENLIGVTAHSDGKIIEDKKIKLFYFKPEMTVAKGIQRYFFHKDENEKKCAECHRIGRETCLECHKNIIKKKYVHGPAGSGDCDVCHEFNPTDGIKYTLKQNAADLCKDCHVGFSPDNFPYLHGPFAAGKCESCHNLHSSDYPRQLLKEANELCKSCHAEFKSPNLTHVTAKHPVSGKKDKSRPGQMMQCSSCHNPHGEKTRLFFVKGSASRVELCRVCHAK